MKELNYLYIFNYLHYLQVGIIWIVVILYQLCLFETIVQLQFFNFDK